MAQVWDFSRAQGGTLLVLLALADEARDNGRCYPSIDRIAHKSRMSARQVQRVLRILQDMGEIKVHIGAGMNAGGRGNTNEYEICVSPNHDLSLFSDTKIKGDILSETKGDIYGIKGDTHVTRTVNLKTLKPANQEIKGDILSEKKQAPDKPARFDPLKMQIPSSVPADAWQRWITYRRERKLTTTAQTAQAQLAKLAVWHGRGHSPPDIIDNSIANGWAGLFEPKQERINGNRSVIEAFTGHGRRETTVFCGTAEHLADGNGGGL